MSRPPTITVDLSEHGVAHRPWALPGTPWRMAMRWASLSFLHWPVPARVIAAHLPDALELDLYDGEAWIGVVPFRMEQTGLRGLPLVPGTHTFGEFNVRTYVRHRRLGRPGVWFFSLDAASPLAVAAARLSFGLPYFTADIDVAEAPALGTPTRVWYASRRTQWRAPAGEFRAAVMPGGEISLSQAEGLVEWFTERYALYAERFGRLVTADVHHTRWPLRHATAAIETNTVAQGWGISLDGPPPFTHYADYVDVVAWPPYVLD